MCQASSRRVYLASDVGLSAMQGIRMARKLCQIETLRTTRSGETAKAQRPAAPRAGRCDSSS